jgi:uncharacterized protein
VQRTFYVFNLTRQAFLSLAVNPAHTHLTRLRGLLGKIKLRWDEGLWVAPCQGIHTIGLLFPIDVIYLDEQRRVIHLIEQVAPFRVTPIRRQSSSVLELPPRTIYSSNTQMGDELLICSPEEMENYWKKVATATCASMQPESGSTEEGITEKVRYGSTSRASFMGIFEEIRRRLRNSADEPLPEHIAGSLVAYFWEGGAPALHAVRDLSTHGAYIVTRDTWYPGTVVQLILQCGSIQVGSGGGAACASVLVRSNVVAQEPDGVRVQFLYLNRRERQQTVKFLETVRSRGKQ